MDICQICLRTDLKPKVIDSRLSDLHDELCDFDFTYTLDPKYCVYCEHLLRKVYNFRAKCIMANKILKKWKTSKRADHLHTLLPSSGLGTWKEANACIFEYVYGVTEQPVLFNNKNAIHPIPTDDIKLEPNAADLPEPTNSHAEESEVLLSNVANDNTILELDDPLMNEDEIKTEDVVDGRDMATHTNLTKVGKSDDIFETVIKNEEESKEANDRNDSESMGGLHYSQGSHGNTLLDKNKDVMKNIKTLNMDTLNEMDRLLESVISDDSSLNSNDDCDSDDFILNDNVYNRKRKKREMQMHVKKERPKTYNTALGDHDYISALKTEPMKKSLLELTNISLSDTEHASDNDSKQKVPKKVVAKKAVKRRKVDQKLSIKEKALKEANKFWDRVLRRQMYTKGRLLIYLKNKFDQCEELKMEDGTVLDKKSIINAIEQDDESSKFKTLWKSIRLTQMFPNDKTLTLLKDIQTRNNMYLKVFDIHYLSTEEKIVEEFKKRMTYEAYINAPYKCDLCHQWYTYKKQLENHMEMHKPKPGSFVCPVCKVTKWNKNSLRGHEKIHKTVYKCKMCPLVTNYRNSMINHYHQHQGVEYKCDTCQSSYKSQSAYKSHITKRCPGKRNFICVNCGEAFLTAYGLRVHKVRKHRGEPPVEDNPDATCTVCSLTFSSVEVYIYHLKITHQIVKEYTKATKTRRRKSKTDERDKTETKTVICKLCNEKGPNFKWMRSHFLAVHRTVDMSLLYPEKMNHLCEICGKVFLGPAGIQSHMNRHLNLRPFPCSVPKCPARFRSPHGVKTHMAYHGPPKFKCKHCGKKFKTSANLYSHTITHIGDRRYKCHICGKGFLYPGSVKEHVRGVHDNVKRIKKKKATKVTKGSEEEKSDSD